MPLPQKAEQYRERLLKLLPQLVFSSGGGGGKDPIEFDLYPRDYLTFAETLLEQHTTEARVGCVGHLKRAVDCQIALFFNCLGLDAFFAEKRLGFDKKLSFIKAVGLVSPRSLNRLNTIRNRVEHEFADPHDADLSLYFDLCQCFISVLESYVFYVRNSAELEFEIENDDDKGHTALFGSSFDAESQTVTVRFLRREKIDFNVSSMEDFTFAMRCHFALISLAYIDDLEECRRRILSA